MSAEIFRARLMLCRNRIKKNTLRNLNSVNSRTRSKRTVKRLNIREGGKFLGTFYVNQNCAEQLCINILLCYMYTFHIVITNYAILSQ